MRLTSRTATSWTLTGGVVVAALIMATTTPSAPPAWAALATQGNRARPSRDTTRPRPFEHERHARLSCLECHGSGAEHRTIRVRTPADCAACHHAPRRALACRTCHDSAGPLAPIATTTAIRIGNAPNPARRTLGFSHELHVKQGALTCGECHSAAPWLTRTRECASCHQSHHTPRARCESCHLTPRAGVHAASVHLSCGGSGCHGADRAPPATTSRETCLACHPARREHETGGDCASCHLIPRETRPAGGGHSREAPR